MTNKKLETRCNGFVSFKDCKTNCPEDKCGEYDFAKDYFKSLMTRKKSDMEERYIEGVK